MAYNVLNILKNECGMFEVMCIIQITLEILKIQAPNALTQKNRIYRYMSWEIPKQYYKAMNYIWGLQGLALFAINLTNDMP